MFGDMQLKVAIFGFALFLGLMSPAAAISKGRVENAKERAAASQKLIAFVIMQECTNTSCPIAVNRVGERNGSIKRAVPNNGVIVVKLDAEDLKKDSTPECVRKTKSVPCVIITNAACTEVIDSVGAGVDKARIAEMELKIAAAAKAP